MDAELRVAICAIAKNEGPYLREWVAYHHLLGFDPIIVYDHESDDESPGALHLEDRGVVEVVLSCHPARTEAAVARL